MTDTKSYTIEDLGLSVTEEELGIVDMQSITCRRLTIVVVETVEGIVVTGTNAPWPEQRQDAYIGLAKARHSAVERAGRMRAAHLEHLARRAAEDGGKARY